MKKGCAPQSSMRRRNSKNNYNLHGAIREFIDYVQEFHNRYDNLVRWNPANLDQLHFVLDVYMGREVLAATPPPPPPPPPIQSPATTRMTVTSPGSPPPIPPVPPMKSYLFPEEYCSGEEEESSDSEILMWHPQSDREYKEERDREHYA